MDRTSAGQGSFAEAIEHSTRAQMEGERKRTGRDRCRETLLVQQRWARANLPHLPEPYVMSAYEVLRYHLGREPSRREVDARVREQWGEWLEVAA